MTLHSLACHGWAECRCAVVYRVRETGSNVRSIRYHGLDGVASRQVQTDNMRAARLGATPPGRAARHLGVAE